MINAIGMLEFNSVAKGIYVADQMVKVADVEIVTANSVCPGKYIAIVHGDVASVENSVKQGINYAEDFLVDHIVIPNVHPDVFPAVIAASVPSKIEALGILESYSLSALVIAADAVLKSAELRPIELRLGTGLGGRAYFTFTGDVADVKTGLEVGMEQVGSKGLLINGEVIPSPSKKLIKTLY